MIKQIDNIILLGTSHVAKKSAKEIEDTINQFSPEVVGIELDLGRLKSILSENKDKKKSSSISMIKDLGLGGFLFGMIAGFIQQKIGKSLGIEPGVDMKKAYTFAREKNIPIALIDINIKTTLRKMSKLSFAKKMKMFFSLFFKSFKKEYRNKLNFDIKKGVPDEKVIKFAMGVFRKEVPDLYKILIEDRNIHMSNRLLKLRENHSGYILAVVGAGHVDGMAEYLEKKIYSNVYNSNENKNNSNSQSIFSFNVQA